MQRSKFKDAERSKGQASRQLDSDGSGSVVSLQSSSSDDGKYLGNYHSEGVGRPPMIQADSDEEMGAQKGAGIKSSDDSNRQKLEKLQQRLHTQPTQDTLDEIIYTMKHQNGINDSSAAAMPLPLHNDSIVGGKTYPSVQPYSGSLGWNAASPLQMSGHQKFGEKHTRQLKDITTHFESEIDKITDQLCSVGNSLSALQDALPVKMLEAANHKLEARCNVLEQVCEQTKNKSTRLEQSNQELDSNCGQLRQINQNLEVRCLYLEQVSRTNESEKSNLHENVRDLEDKVMELAASSEKTIVACRQLEELNQKWEIKSQAIEESRKKLESKYKSCVADNQKFESQIGQCQKTLDQYKKKFRDFEETLSASKREKERLAMKLESSNKGHMQVKQKYEELKSICAPKDELISRLENEMKELSGFVDKTIKEKTEAEGNSRRDKELLQRMLVEYDVLAKDYQEAQDSRKAVNDKLELSQNEMASLRETISKLVCRNSVLEECSKDDALQENSRIEQSTRKNKPITGRKTWEQSTPIKKRVLPPHSLATSYNGSEFAKDTVGAELATSCPPYATTIGYSGALAMPDFSSSGPKSSTPSSHHKRQQIKPVPTKENPDFVPTEPNVVPGGMVVKKTDLLTRFDVVFEDAKSGEEMIRTHTGRTRRMYSDPPQTEAGFLTAGNEAAGGIAESTYGGAHDSKLLAVEDYDRTISEPRKTKSKNQSAMYNIAEKDIGVQSSRPASKDHTEENEFGMQRLMEKRFSMLTEEKKQLESTLSRIPTPKMTKRVKQEKAYLEARLDEVVKEIATVRTQLRRHHGL